MIELPESKRLAEQMEEFLTGKIIQNVVVNTSPHKFAFYFGKPVRYQEILSGKRITGARAVGGQVLLLAEDARILFSDGVNPRYLAQGEPAPKKHQLLMEFDDFSHLVCTVQMYGGMMAFLEGENKSPYYLAALEKPSPLTDVFDRAYFEQLRRSTKETLSVKAFLATEQRIPGLGNGVLQDILFRAGIHPKTKLMLLTDPEADKLFYSVKETLLQMTAGGGRDTEKDLFGCFGGYKSLLSKNTVKHPCPVCGGEIIRQAYLGGNVYFCPVCQPLKEAKA